MRILKKFIILVMAVLFLPVWSYAAADSVFIRIDRDDPNAWKEDQRPRNRRKAKDRPRDRPKNRNKSPKGEKKK